MLFQTFCSKPLYRFLLLSSLLFSTTNAVFASILVEKQVFKIKDFKTFNGKTIPSVTLGWEAYGTLNANKSNAILITHYFSGSSHAAGKYAVNDEMPGYWDTIIGPGKAIDTDKFYVLSMDTLANINTKSEQVITTGPASVNPATGKPWGLDFPVLTIRDFVNSQKALLDSLGIEQLLAVIGPSMGSMQAIDWAVAYPNQVRKMVSVIGVVESDAWLVAGLQKWAAPILSDPNWHEGDYYHSEGPIDGLTQSLAIITQEAMNPAIFNQLNPQHSAMEKAPSQSIKQQFTTVNWLYDAARKRAATMDANHLLYLVRACQLFIAGHSGNLNDALKKVTADTLFLPAKGDLLLLPEMAKSAHQRLTEMGKNSQYAEINGDWGHLDGIYTIQNQANTLKQFLEEE